MLYAEFELVTDKTRENAPLIHAITNPISINQCANVILALGARPIMAEHPDEVGEITASSEALLINLGNITDVRMKSAAVSLSTAKEKNIPAVLDAVGVACSVLRKSFAKRLLNDYEFSVVKGNYSEINALFDEDYKTSGVDADISVAENYIKDASVKLAKRYNAVILASGKTDIITDGEKLVCVKNGTGYLSKITGTGCMLGAMTAAFLPCGDGLKAAATACAIMGISGELSESEKGNGSFQTKLLDNIGNICTGEIKKYLKAEVTFL